MFWLFCKVSPLFDGVFAIKAVQEDHIIVNKGINLSFVEKNVSVATVDALSVSVLVALVDPGLCTRFSSSTVASSTTPAYDVSSRSATRLPR